MAKFDEIDVIDDSSNILVTFAKPVDPLEGTWGYFDPVTHLWVSVYPDDWIYLGLSGGFGINSSGDVYYDSAGPTPGEEADLYVNPGQYTVLLLSGADR